MMIKALIKNNMETEMQDFINHRFAEAVGRNHFNDMNFLLNKGAQVNSLNYFGQTPLQQAVYHDAISTMQQLLENGVDINYTDIEESTALRTAFLIGADKFVEWLLKNGADANLRNRYRMKSIEKANLHKKYILKRKTMKNYYKFTNEIKILKEKLKCKKKR